MGSTKISVTIPDEIYKEFKALAAERKIKFSHLVSDAIAEKARRMKEEAFVREINEIFDDPEVREEHSSMSEAIAESASLEELPW